MNVIDWLLFLGYCWIVAMAWRVTVNPKSGTALRLQQMRDQGIELTKAPVRHERKRDKRTGN
jgi:hypothetical protein